MTSRWKAALISSVICGLGLAASPPSQARVIHAASFTGAQLFSAKDLERGSRLRGGLVYSDSLVSLEVSRIDSLYFSRGRLAVEVRVDTTAAKEGIDVRLEIREGEPTRIGTVSVSGAEIVGERGPAPRILPREGEEFDPYDLERSLLALLRLCNESGYPFAQVWLTGFAYRDATNEVDIGISVSVGERSKIARVTFDGLAKTDSAVALRTSRLEPGSTYEEGRIDAARQYLRASGYFESIGEATVERRAGGAVDVVIPVKEMSRNNLVEGALGFSRKDQGKYAVNGSVDLDLKNIAGTGRYAHFDWLNDGERYSKLDVSFREPFLFSKSLRLDAELTQVIQDTAYIWHSAGLSLGVPVGPASTIIAGIGGDRNVPSSGALLRSVRERFRLGLARETGGDAGLACSVEGAYRKNYLRGDRAEGDGQVLYHFDGALAVAAFGRGSVFLRLASDAVFSNGGVSLAEMFPLGGAKTLRGYRENQFRGEKIAFTNIEYRFGEGGWFFLFDDVGAFYRREDRWTVKNGTGFGLRSESERGVVSLSFGVGDRLSFEGTRIHILLSQKF